MGRRDLFAILGTIALGAMGGAVFFALTLPLPWMLGALFFTLTGALCKAPLKGPEQLRPALVAVIGVLLGAAFTPEVLGQIWLWALSLSFLALYVALAAALVVPFYHLVGRMDPVTALFAAMPGGLTEMMEIGRSLGGDDRQIILSHAARIAVSVSLIAIWFRGVLGFEVSGFVTFGDKDALGWSDAGILIACGLLGGPLGRRLRLPAPMLLGTMILSALAHLTGLTAAAPPAWLVVVAQVLLGTIMGCRFLGCAPALALRALALALVATGMMMALALGFALLIHGWIDQTPEQVLLAYAPGGLTEMSLVALSMQADVAYIALHHVVRIAILLAIAPSLLGFIARQWRQRS